MLNLEFDKDLIDLGLSISFDRETIQLESDSESGYFSSESLLTFSPHF